MTETPDLDTLLILCAGLLLAGDDAPLDPWELLGRHKPDAIRRMRGMTQAKDWASEADLPTSKSSLTRDPRRSRAA